MNRRESYAGKSVFITGHTGFKGSWLTEWLLFLGARVTGYSLPPPTTPALFLQLGLQDRITHFEADIRQADKLRRAMRQAKPDFVFHLAAQSLVRLSYAQPRETYDVNVMGTVNVLESLRDLSDPCAAVLVTTDKCYAEKAAGDAYKEDDALGGQDPYGSSKAAAELAIAAYRRAFFSQPDSKVNVASARSGNVIGGGDWAVDRILPDSIRSLTNGKSIGIRNRSATRPWQHVLEPLSGYLELGAALARQSCAGELASAFNFGPSQRSEHSVLELVQEILKHWPGTWHDEVEPGAPHEALRLSLDTDRAARLLGWRPVYNFTRTVKQTVEWYKRSVTFAPGDSAAFAALTRGQITDYDTLARETTLVASPE